MPSVVVYVVIHAVIHAIVDVAVYVEDTHKAAYILEAGSHTCHHNRPISSDIPVLGLIGWLKTQLCSCTALDRSVCVRGAYELDTVQAGRRRTGLAHSSTELSNEILLATAFSRTRSVLLHGTDHILETESSLIIVFVRRGVRLWGEFGGIE